MPSIYDLKPAFQRLLRPVRRRLGVDVRKRELLPEHGPALRWEGSVDAFMGRIEAAMEALAAEGKFPVWE